MISPSQVGNVVLGGPELFLIAGPCVIENEKSLRTVAESLKEITGRLGIPFVFKTSYDKANRLSADSYRGPGLEAGLEILSRLKNDLGIPILCDVHCRSEVVRAAEVVDVIQIPAFLSRQTDLLQEAARTGKPINIKKGQFLAPWDIKPIIKKAEKVGCRQIILTERGVSFGYNNLVSDMRAIPIMRTFGYPVVYDATHSVQLPGGIGTASGGQREMIPHLARAAVAAGCDGIFLEVHDDPDNALCDGPNMLPLNRLEPLLESLISIREILVKRRLV